MTRRTSRGGPRELDPADAQRGRVARPDRCWRIVESGSRKCGPAQHRHELGDVGHAPGERSRVGQPFGARRHVGDAAERRLEARPRRRTRPGSESSPLRRCRATRCTFRPTPRRRLRRSSRPLISSRAQGLRVEPATRLTVLALHPYSDVVVFPTTIAPAARRRATAGASSAARWFGSRDPLRVGSSARLNEVLDRHRDPEQRPVSRQAASPRLRDQPVGRCGPPSGRDRRRPRRTLRSPHLASPMACQHRLHMLGDRGMTKQKHLPCLMNTSADWLPISGGDSGDLHATTTMSRTKCRASSQLCGASAAGQSGEVPRSTPPRTAGRIIRDG